MARTIMRFGCEVTPYGLIRTWWEFDGGEIIRGAWQWPPQERREKFRRVDARGNRRKQ